MRECGLAGCARKHYSRGLCEAHYARQRRSGATGAAEVKNRSVAGKRCRLDACMAEHYAKDLCQVHYVRWRKHGDPNVVGSSAPIRRRTRTEHHNWSGEDIGYRGVHHRVTRELGLASAHSCRHCGASAADWAYDHADLNEQVDGRGRVYSTDPDRYMPLCRRCHSAFDRGCAAA